MKKVLIYGDSNVWGDNFITGKRLSDNKQWVNIVREHLKEKYIIFQEGLPGRIAGNEEKEKKYKNGKDNFISTFRTKAPVDIILIALGTNDLQIKYNKTSKAIFEDLLWYKKAIEESYKDIDDRKKYFVNEQLPRIIYILPINFDYKKNASIIFNEQSEKKRQEIISKFKTENIPYIRLDNMPLLEDGIHLNEEGHKKQAQLVEKEIVKYGDKVGYNTRKNKL